MNMCFCGNHNGDLVAIFFKTPSIDIPNGTQLNFYREFYVCLLESTQKVTLS